MATVSVLIPWRGGCPHRDRAWAWLRRRWQHTWPEWELVEGACGDGLWRKAEAVRDAANRATGDLLVMADADVWCDTVDQAVDMLDQRAWAIPHDDVHRLTEEATTAVLNGAPIEQTSLTQRPYRGHAGGGIVALHRDVLDQVPLDPRFHGWGQEDDSWALALTTLAGKPWRGRSDLWHLWHPPADRLNRITGSPESDQLYQRYRQARHQPNAMRALIEETRAATPA